MAIPLVETVATFVLSDCQLACAVTVEELPSEMVTVATRCVVCPMERKVQRHEILAERRIFVSVFSAQ